MIELIFQTIVDNWILLLILLLPAVVINNYMYGTYKISLILLFGLAVTFLMVFDTIPKNFEDTLYDEPNDFVRYNSSTYIGNYTKMTETNPSIVMPKNEKHDTDDLGFLD